MKLTDEQLMDILKEAVKAIAIKYNSIVAENEVGEVTKPVTEVAPKEIPKKEVETPQPKVESPKPVEKEEVTNKEVIEDTNRNGEETPHSSREVLEAMSYNELKVLAKETGVKAIGNKQTLIDKILEAQMSTIDPNTTQTTDEIEEARETQSQVEEEDVQESQVDNAQEEEEDTVEFEEEAIEDQEEDEDNLYTRLVKETMDMSDEEIADLLADVGISPKGRRQALLSKLEQAVRDGLIAFGDDEDEEDTEEVTETPAKEEYTDVDEDNSDEEEVIEIAGSEERVAKVEELYEKYVNQYMNDEISDKEILDFLKDYYNENDHEYKSLVENATNEELADHYCLIHAQLVDDDGEEYDWGEPYIVEDEYWCSGKPMKMLDENTLYDEVTGEQFELQ